ncbi:MAG: sulfatase [Planctomycetota bacterium]|nr:sulfatase [Planctomycetota bacterium]
MRSRPIELLALALLSGCADEGAPDGPNLILISIDTLRADRLGCYGYERDTSPAIDALAERGVLFRTAIAESSWTLPSHVTMLSGLYPSTHGVERPERRPGSGTRLLAERLRDAGWTTFAITDGGWLSPAFGFARGFLDYRAELAGTEAHVNELIQRIEPLLGGERPFFAFLHTYDVHCPYDPPEPYASLFRSEERAEIETAGRCGNPHFNAMDLDAGEARFLSDRYDGSIRRVDDALRGLFDLLEERGALEDTVVVLTSDHGEEFLEHGRIGHERTLEREVLFVPLIVVAPGLGPRVETHPVGLVDIVPTVLELLGLPAAADVEGQSLVRLARGEAADGEYLPYRYSELDWKASLVSWSNGETHVVRERGEGGAGHELFERMAPLLLARRTEPRSHLRAELPAEAAGQLSALGY